MEEEKVAFEKPAMVKFGICQIFIALDSILVIRDVARSAADGYHFWVETKYNGRLFSSLYYDTKDEAEAARKEFVEKYFRVIK